jgi:hypothetical protein
VEQKVASEIKSRKYNMYGKEQEVFVRGLQKSKVLAKRISNKNFFMPFFTSFDRA